MGGGCGEVGERQELATELTRSLLSCLTTDTGGGGREVADGMAAWGGMTTAWGVAGGGGDIPSPWPFCRQSDNHLP